MAASLSTQRGFTLLEILCVVGITAVVMVGLLRVGGAVQTDNQIAATERLLATLSKEAVAYHKLNGSYAPLSCESFADPSCYFVQKQIVAADAVNPFGGDVAMTNVADAQLKISFRNISKQACTELLQNSAQYPKLKAIELMDTNQQIINDSQNVVCVQPPHGSGSSQETAFATTSSCSTGGGSFTVTSVQRFPVLAGDAALICEALPRYLVSWTFE